MKALCCLMVLAAATLAAGDYVLGPDSQRQPGVPRGKVTKYTFTGSKIYPGSNHEYWVYVPEQYDAINRHV